MTGKEMIKIIQDNGLEDFKLKINRLVSHDGGWGFVRESSYIDELVDIGHSEKIVTFDLIEE